jgi:hypothetical protein
LIGFSSAGRSNRLLCYYRRSIRVCNFRFDDRNFTLCCSPLLQPISMVGGVVAAVDGSGKDAAASYPGRPALPMKPKLLRPLLLLAVLGTGFLAVVVLLLGGSTYSVLPRLPVPDALSASSSSSSRQQACAGSRGANSPLERWTRAPASAWHNMSDEELLWAASWRPARRAGGGGRHPSRRVPKVAFMFLTRGPLPLAPLWERFFAGAGSRDLYSVYVHATPGYRDEFPPTSPFHRRQVPSQVRHPLAASSGFAFDGARPSDPRHSRGGHM